MTLATQPRTKSRVNAGIGFYMTIDEKAEGSLALVKALHSEPKVLQLQRSGNGFYFIVGTEAKITEICDKFPGCLMKMEPVL
jgi:hypothetical protein